MRFLRFDLQLVALECYQCTWLFACIHFLCFQSPIQFLLQVSTDRSDRKFSAFSLTD